MIEQDKEMVENVASELAEKIFNTSFKMWSVVVESCNIDLMKDLNSPDIGDLVFEVTNPFIPKIRCIGELMENKGSNYTIKCFDGKIHEWENAKFIKVPDDNTMKVISKL